jgi:hypothetical protein
MCGRGDGAWNSNEMVSTQRGFRRLNSEVRAAADISLAQAGVQTPTVRPPPTATMHVLYYLMDLQMLNNCLGKFLGHLWMQSYLIYSRCIFSQT